MRTGPGVAPDAMHSLAEQRFIAIGRTPAGRPVVVAFCFRGARIRHDQRPPHAREGDRLP